MPETGIVKLASFSRSVTSGLIVGVILTFFNVSMAALVFKGALTPYLADGLSFVLSGTVILVLVTAVLSSFPNAISVVQEVPIGILALLAADIAYVMRGAGHHQIYATVLGAILVSTLLTALLFWLLGRFQLGQYIRFVPYPVIGGFLAGTGWLLVSGALQVMTGVAPGAALLEPAMLARWLPGVLFGLVLLVALRRLSHFLALPLLLLGMIALFYALLALLGATPAAALSGGWLLGPLPVGRLFDPTAVLAVKDADWHIVFAHHGPSLVAIPLISVLALLLNASALEVALARDADLNRELRASGIANGLALLVGSPPGFIAVTETVLGQRFGASGRLLGYTIAAFSAVTVFFGAASLSYIPRIAIGGLLCFLGFTFLLEWLYEAWFRLSRVDNVLIWLITIVIGAVGFLEGVAIGTFIAAILFVVNYSRINAVRHFYSRSDHPSNVSRPQAHEQILRQHGEQIVVAELQGYLFFGTAHRLVRELRTRLQTEQNRQIRFLIVDFRLVTGMDSSVMLSFQRLVRYLENMDTQPILTNLPPELQRNWEREAAAHANVAQIPIIDTLDQGLAWCEEQLLRSVWIDGADEETQSFAEMVRQALPQTNHTHTHPDLAPLLDSLHRHDVQPGQMIIRAGDLQDGIFYVASGEVVAQTRLPDGRRIVLRRMQKGAIFGEISFYTDDGASADVVAEQPGTLYQLSRESMARLEQAAPDIAIAVHRMIARGLSHKFVQSMHSLRVLKG